jgi:hypothetical protein
MSAESVEKERVKWEEAPSWSSSAPRHAVEGYQLISKKGVVEEQAARQPAARSAAAAAPLPRQININSNESPNPNANKLTPYRAKRKFAVQEDVAGFARQWGGEDYCAELTLTFAENITEKAEASRRFNSLRTALFGLGIRSYIGCWERQQRGAWHLHLIVAMAHAVRNLPDARVYLQGVRNTICGTAENEHKDGLLMKRGFGYIHHLAPIKKTVARFAGYFTSYLTKTWKQLQGEKKRVRLITYARNVIRSASVHFSWNGPNGINWRHKKRMFAFSKGCFSLEAAKDKLGATWEYKYRLEIASQKLVRHASPLCDIADNFRDIPFEEAFRMGSGGECFEYWRRLRVKNGLPMNTLEKNPDGSPIRIRTDRQEVVRPF